MKPISDQRDYMHGSRQTKAAQRLFYLFAEDSLRYSNTLLVDNVVNNRFAQYVRIKVAHFLQSIGLHEFHFIQ
jgi:hypothetical protein